MVCMATPEILLADSIASVMPRAVAQEGVRLLGVGVENVLVHGGDTAVSPEAAAQFEAFRAAGITPVLITNHRHDLAPSHVDSRFIDEVTAQLGGIRAYYPKNYVRGKAHKDLFVMAQQDAEVDPSACAQVDDQLLTYWGLRRAGWRTFFWTLPYGRRQSLSGRLLQPFEATWRAWPKDV